MSTVYLEVDGNPVPASELFWLVRASCGCWSGSLVADRGDFGVLTTEEQARSDMHDGIKALIQRSVEDGETYHLMTREQFREVKFDGKCSHNWGRKQVDAPDGFAWATTDRWYRGRRSHKRHIVSAEAVGEYEAAAVCGYRPSRMAATWSDETEYTRETVTCRKCESKAVAA